MGAWIEIWIMWFGKIALFLVAPFMGAWIEILLVVNFFNFLERSRPSWARGLK